MGANSHIIDLSKLDKFDLDIVGKKAVELSELMRLGIPIPDGFVITTSFFKEFLRLTDIDKKIKEVRKLNHPSIQDSVGKLYSPIKKQILYTPIPRSLVAQLHTFYRKLSGIFNDQSLNIFTFSSNNKSISYTNIKGDANLILKIKEIWAFHIDKPIAIVVQKNIESKIRGKMFTNDPLINDQNLLKLAKKVQKHFYFPKALDYAVQKGKIYITQLKPFTSIVDERPKILIKGIPVNPGIVTGAVKLINNHNFAVVKNSEIIVTKSLNKLSYNRIKKVKAVVADTILQSSIDKFHYRKIIRAPTIMGTENSTKLLQNGNIITVNGTVGEIYSGGLN